MKRLVTVDIIAESGILQGNKRARTDDLVQVATGAMELIQRNLEAKLKMTSEIETLKTRVEQLKSESRANNTKCTQLSEHIKLLESLNQNQFNSIKRQHAELARIREEMDTLVAEGRKNEAKIEELEQLRTCLKKFLSHA
ncbi:hypothetical protein NHQ30_010587 [Ciborinia camelliae]|nr:hypothetical protein NHQ30_010587 [Ciborinia camelliae]